MISLPTSSAILSRSRISVSLMQVVFVNDANESSSSWASHTILLLDILVNRLHPFRAVNTQEYSFPGDDTPDAMLHDGGLKGDLTRKMIEAN